MSRTCARCNAELGPSRGLEEHCPRCLLALALEDDGSLTQIGGTRIPRRRSTRYGLEWSAATAPGAADGSVRLLRKRKIRVRANDLANGGRVVEELVVGLPAGVDVPGSGSFLLDEFVITP